MANLDEVLGAILSGVANARRIADQETAAIAEFYRNNPLLEGMTVPRIRLPEVVVDIPLVIEGFEAGTEERPETPSRLANALKAELNEYSRNRGVVLPRGFIGRFDTEVKTALAGAQLGGFGTARSYARATEKAVTRLLSHGDFAGRFDHDFVRGLVDRLGEAAVERGVKQDMKPPHFRVLATTGEVKDKADPSTVTNLRVVLKEEGLEWSIGEREDGTTFRKLIPE